MEKSLEIIVAIMFCLEARSDLSNRLVVRILSGIIIIIFDSRFRWISFYFVQM